MSARQTQRSGVTKTRTGKRSSKLTAAFIEEWANFKPIIDQATLDEMNATAESVSVTRERRLTFWLLTQDVDSVSKLSEKEPEFYADIMGFVSQFRDRTKAMLQAAENAYARLQIANVGAGHGATR